MEKSLYLRPVLVLLLIMIASVSQAQDYTYYNNLAKKEYENKNYYNTVDYATRSINASANGEAYWWRGMARSFLKNYADATADFSSAISYYSSDRSSLGKLYYWRAKCKAQQGLNKDAVSDYQAALSYDYEDKMSSYWGEGAAYYNIGEYQQSIDAYTTAINMGTQSTDLALLYKNRGDAKGVLYKYDEAIADYSKAIEYNPRYANAFWERGYYRGKNSQYEMAIGDFTAAIKLLEQGEATGSNDLSILYNNRGLYQYYLGKYAEAKLDMQQSLNQNPNYDYANWNMGLILNALHNYKEANGYFLQAASLMKNDIDRASCYADLYWSDRTLLDYRQALIHINEAIRLNHDQRRYYWNRAYLYDTRSEYPDALADYSKAIDLYSNDTSSLVSIYIERGQMKVKMKDNAGALKDFQKAAELTPSYYTYYELGRFFKEVVKQHDLATINLQKAAILAVKKDTTSNYAYVEAIQDNKQEAIRVVEGMIKKESANIDRLKWELHNAACIHALLGNTQKAMEYVEQSLAIGYDGFDHLVNDRDLESLKLIPAYKLMLAKYKVPVPRY